MGDVEKLKLLRADKMSTSNIDENEDEDRAIFCKLEISAHWADLSKKSFVYHNTEWTPSID